MVVQMSRGKVLVIGGGIGGLATAIALRHADYEVNVLELRADLESSIYGVGIIQPTNALRALDRIGCLDACLEVGYAAKAWGRKLDVDGNLLLDMPGAAIEGYAPLNGLTRPDLHRILTEKTLEVGASIEYGKTFTELEDGPEGIDVTYNDGTANRVDFVVGADGARSKVRSYVLGEMKPTYLGQSAFRMNIPRLPEIDRIILQEGPDGMAGFVPIGPDLAYIFYNARWPDRNRRVADEDLARVFREHLEPFGGLTGFVRDNYITDERSSEIVLRPEDYSIAPAPWHSGRIVLIGDAVHAITPHLGQGAAQAIEDGVVLAEALASHDDLESGFKSYTERRYPRCKQIVDTSVNIGLWELDPTIKFDHVGETQRVIESMVLPL
jgi:2-polyprenyl-6-methoxyphenol hydroxylase-like FAD-dependent oxidoreductase